MSPESAALAISAGGVVISAVTAAAIAGARWGSTNTRLDLLERSFGTLASKEQLAGVKEDVAEIKGMFRMTLKDGPGSG